MNPIGYTEEHAEENASIEVSACCRSFVKLPKSFDQKDHKAIATFCRDLRDWLASQGHTDRRILIQRWEYMTAPDEEAERSGRYDRVAWSVQWDGEEGQAHEWTRAAFLAGMDADLLAALVGAKDGDALVSLHGHGMAIPGVKRVQRKRLSEQPVPDCMKDYAGL